MNYNVPLRYHLLVYRREQLWLPAGLWGLFAILIVINSSTENLPTLAGGFLGMVLPLMAGILGTSAIVDDPALELHLASPRRPWQTLLEREAIVLGIVAVGALAFQVFLGAAGVSVAHLGNLVEVQLVWLMPSLVTMALAGLIALGFAQGMVGVLGAGVLWVGQFFFRDWFLETPWAHQWFLFMGQLWPTCPNLAANRLSLLALAVLFTFLSAMLLKKEERYL